MIELDTRPVLWCIQNNRTAGFSSHYPLSVQGITVSKPWCSFHEIMTDTFYNSKRWKNHLRPAILARDHYMDQLELRAGRRVPADTVHHIFPKDRYPQYQWCAWNLISLSRENHEAMHIRLTGELTAAGQKLMADTAAERGIKLSTLTLVVGLPGSGKTTYTRRVMGGGLAYDLDYIAAAFRLRGPHSERHDPARRLANGMAKAFAANAQRFASQIWVIRTAPYLDEVIDMEPDRIVVCHGKHSIADRADYQRIDEADMQKRIDELVDWAEANKIPIENVS